LSTLAGRAEHDQAGSSQMAGCDYVCIGHVTRDLRPGGYSWGGTVTYSARTAQALGCRPAVVTRAESQLDLTPALGLIPVHRLDSAATTTFENTYGPVGRRQKLLAWAGRISAADLPQACRAAPVIHLAPVAQEVDSALIGLLTGSVIGLTPQGWHRRWDDSGTVSFAAWPEAAEVLPLATAVIVSREDITDQASWEIYRQCAHLLVVTDGAAGCEVSTGGKTRWFRTTPVVETDPTGVGDVFAAAFFVRLWETGGDAWAAARFATRIAAPTVARPGLAGIPMPDEVATARAEVA